MEALQLGLVNWLATTIVVESALLEPVRVRVERRWPRLGYLLDCHLCTGTWVGFALAAAFRRHPGVAGFVFDALLYKAIGHLVLDVVATAAALRRRWSIAGHPSTVSAPPVPKPVPLIDQLLGPLFGGRHP